MILHTYLFEAKSIQSYLFNSGKLRDTIAASERLDALIDDTSASVLSKVLGALNIDNDLTDEQALTKNSVHFVRCKGAALYAYSQSLDTLVAFRQLWTLSVQQLFPRLHFIDGLGQGSTIALALVNGHEALKRSKNLSPIQVPITMANMARYDRTGLAAIDAKITSRQENEVIDSDTLKHRVAYQSMRTVTEKNAFSLHQKFTPKGFIGLAKFPINLETSKNEEPTDFPYLNNKQDLALIHIDGNNLGLVLRKLTSALSEADVSSFQKVFRGFSAALADATEEAAKQASLILNAKDTLKTPTFLPMRPLILGGDDLTILCRADLAIDYAVVFCEAFENTTRKCFTKLKALGLDKNILNQLPEYLTASGGLSFQKASQPYATANHIVEGQTISAKALGKANPLPTGLSASALSFFRISAISASDFSSMFAKNNIFEQKVHKCNVQIGFASYLVKPIVRSDAPSIQVLLNIVDWFCINSHLSLSLNTLRKAIGSLALGDLDEATKIIDRACTLTLKAGGKEPLEQLKGLFSQISNSRNTAQWWIWETKKSDLRQTIIGDVVMLAKFKNINALSAKETAHEA